jgi:hypothetical protein
MEQFVTGQTNIAKTIEAVEAEVKLQKNVIEQKIVEVQDMCDQSLSMLEKDSARIKQ